MHEVLKKRVHAYKRIRDDIERVNRSIDFNLFRSKKILFVVYIIYLLLRYSNIKYYGYFDDVNGSFSEVNGSRVMSRTNGEQSGRSRVRKIDRSLFLPRR